MKKTARLLALLLALTLCMGMVLLPAGAADGDILIAPAPVIAPAPGTPVDKATAQQAIIQTALAYYDKGMPVQYDSNNVTIQNKNDYGGACRLTSGEAPEEGGSDHTIYSVCSDYCYDVYFNTFGYKLMGSPRMCRTSPMTAVSAKDPIIVCKYDATGADPDAMKDLQTAIDKARSILEPGDVIVGYGSSGHAMLYIGDYKNDGTDYIIHCWGSKYSGDTGVDSVETKVKNANPKGGAIRLESVDENVFSKDGSGSWSLYKEAEHAKTFVIMRPLNAPELASPVLTKAAETRMEYRGIQVDKETDKGNKYYSLQNGDEVTLTVTVTNHGTEDFKSVPVTEPLPTGAAFKDGSITENGKAENGAVTWTVDVPVGKSVDLCYTVTVTAKRGEKVDFPRGAVEGLDTRAFAIPVQGKPLAADKLDKLERLAAELNEFKNPESYLELTELQFINHFYSTELGIELNLPEHLNDYIDNMSVKTNVVGVSEKQEGWMWVPKAVDQLTGAYKTVNAMLIPEHFAGYAVYLEGSPDKARDDWSMVNRIAEYKESFYQPGDIFFGLCDPDVKRLNNTRNMVAYVYLGDGRVAAWNEAEGLTMEYFSNTIACMLNKNFILCLRPSLGVDDMNQGIAENALPFTDVGKAEWYYSFVKELYEKGIVSGMTANTFAPKANLTYGQALKLIICALGQDEQPGDSTHWASGYLKFAKDESWLTEDVDLNKNITRLQFCQIAAKAKKLTEGPDVNPFTDCSDDDVLALVAAGVINGMTEDTFQPNGLLTRAQITKIISGLLKLN